MKTSMNRRDFSKTIALGLGAAAMPGLWAAETPRKLKIGHTCITWGTFPPGGRRGPEAGDALETSLKDISAFGFHSFETFPQVLEYWEAKENGDGLKNLIAKYNVPLRSAYYTANLTDPSRRSDEVQTVIRMARLVKKYGGNFLVIAPNGRGTNFDFQAVRKNIVDSLNEYAKAITDQGIGTGLHQHTNTAVDLPDEVYAVMEAVNTRLFKFAPDVGQLQKAGADAAKIVKDFLPITVQMHLKDWSGWEHHSGYCPLGMGKVDIKGILDMIESAHPDAGMMIELDPARNGPMSPTETVRVTKTFLEKLGYQFRA